VADRIDATLDEIERRLERALRAVNKRIAEIVPDTRDQQAALAAAMDARAQIVQMMGAYNREVDRLIEEYRQAAEMARQQFGVDAAFSTVDQQLIEGMIMDAADELRAAGLQKAQEISQVIYMGAIAGTPKGDIIEQVRQLLIGGTDKRGRPLASYAATIAHTRYMEIHSTATLRLAEQRGIKRFRYAGTLVRDTREWCRRHLGKVLTLDEIRAWRDKDWAGKKPGDPFITRGGWNCRHRWMPVVDR